MPQDTATQSLFLTTIFAAPFVGCFAATAVRAHISGESAFWGRSRCGHCQYKLAIWDLIPIFSWLANYGRCRHCSSRVSILYPYMESTFVVITLIVVNQNDSIESFIMGIILGWALITLCAFDIAAFVLPNIITYALIYIGVGVAFLQGTEAGFESVAGGCAGAIFLIAVKYAYLRMRGRDGLGMGDVKLFAAAGAWVGIDGLPQVLLLGSLLGLLHATVIARNSQDISSERIPFGVGLSIGFGATWLYGSLLP
ncbi:prepilin peptidase [Rhodomicrobium lacus]|uniref:prepilin peptidase n=1 Tax=Rhodomicrobium lacus TaxID=2498452 RepID=UPI000F8E0C2D|nr:A24 family peptidase [Rhodomicrobium lacus]